MKRNVVDIDDAKCDGCGVCIPDCPEGAIQIIDGKARLVSDLFCDGLGACIGHCPKGAITIEEREADAYDEGKVMENVIKGGPGVIAAHLKHLKDHGQHEYLSRAIGFLRAKGMPVPAVEGDPAPAEAGGGCPGARTLDLSHPPGCPGARTVDSRAQHRASKEEAAGPVDSELRQWPVQLQLVNPNASYFKGADIVIAADCVPFAYADFHRRFLSDKTLIIFCPKLDRMPDAYLEKLSEIFKANDIKSVTVVHMEVPCCFGLTKLVEEAARRSGKTIGLKDYTVSIRGTLV
jgi:ferredoxin